MPPPRLEEIIRETIRVRYGAFGRAMLSPYPDLPALIAARIGRPKRFVRDSMLDALEAEFIALDEHLTDAIAAYRGRPKGPV